ncbi:MAG TPA: Calx-beta domain-containing protein, partial [Planctomycetaceae bacterium]
YEGVTTPQTLTFAAGETSKEVRVRVFNDTLLEPTETFALNLSNPTNATLPASPAVGTILDDDTPTITIDDVSVLESEGFAVFTVRLSKPLAADTVTVDFATRADTAFDGSDFFGRFGTIVFQPGETVKQVAVRIVSDNVREPLERFFVDLSNPFNGTLAKGIGTVRILDQPAPIGLVVAPNVGFEPLVKVYDARGDQVRLQFYAYAPTFRGGVRVATGGDVNGDGITDIVVSPVQGPAPVRVFDGLTGALLQQYFPFTSAFTGGLSVAMGDVTGDGLADVIVGIASQGGAVRVFDGPTGRILAAWYAFSPSFAGGLSVAAGDITGDGRVEVFAGILSQGGPSVVVRDALTGAFRSGFSAYNPAFTGGVNVAAGDIDGDGLAEAVVSLASQGDAVRVFSFVPQGNGTYSAAIRSAYNVFSPAFTGGITVGVTDIDFDGRAEVIAAPASGSQTAVRFFDGLTGRLLKFALPYPASFTGGAFVAGQTYPGVQPLRLDGAALASSAEPAVTQAQVAALAKEAARRLAAAGASAADLAKLATVTIAVADLPGTYLGQARPGSVVIDVNAGGHGWFVDATPDRDEEFARGTDGVYRAVAPQAKGRIDLLTVLTHELAHQLGFRDLDPATSPNSLMTATLGKSVRRATKEHVDDLFAADDLLEELLTV